ncbi:site-specific integrase [Methylocaldum gracile]|jgi:hypothetical protein|uniref:hypothetical protein n=1 Tax=Methylocaldum sp. 0917 TaxID=2485163 RepID=UPI0010DD1E8E
MKWDQIREGAIWLEQRKTKAKLRIELVGKLAEVVERIKARGSRDLTILTDPKEQLLKPFGYFRSHFDKARNKAEKEAKELGFSLNAFNFGSFVQKPLRILKACLKPENYWDTPRKK